MRALHSYGEIMNRSVYLLLVVFSIAAAAHAQISNFQHIVIIFQENRTPDNLFQGLCIPPYGNKKSCSATPIGSQYDILTTNWLDKTSTTGVTIPTPIALANNYDPSHTHSAFLTSCDPSAPGVCRMDGAAQDTCTGDCQARFAFHYVGNAKGIMNPYLS